MPTRLPARASLSLLAMTLAACSASPDPSPSGAPPGTASPAPSAHDAVDSGARSTFDAGVTVPPSSGSSGGGHEAGAPLDGGRVADAEGATPDAGACPDIAQLLQGECGGCHNAHDALDLASKDIGARLAGSKGQNGDLMVDPKDPRRSALYEKCTANPPYGSRMPVALPPLDDATLSCLATWIGSL